MKLLKKEELNNILVPHLKPINEKAVHWNRSVLGLLVDTILSPLSWLKSLLGINVSQVKVLAMQWGAEYALSIQKVLEEEGKVKNKDEEENLDDDKSDHPVIDSELIDIFNSYKEDITKLLETLNKIYKDTSNNDISIYTGQLAKLNIMEIIFSKKYKNIIEFIYGDPDNKVFFEELIKKCPYNNFEKQHDGIEDLINNITKHAKSKDDKEPVQKIITLISEFMKNFVIVFSEAHKLVTEAEKQQDETISFYNYKYLYNVINEETTIIGQQTSKTPELPDNVKELMDEDILNTAKQIQNIKEKSAKHLNYASLNTIRYSANYIINKNEKERDKAQHAFDKAMLDVNNYFQDVIDTDKAMQKATGQVDANIQKQITSSQDSIDELSNLKITDIKADKEFKLGEVYAFQMNVTTTKNKGLKAIMFLTPYTISNNKYNSKIADEEFYTFKYLGSYKYDKDKQEIVSWNPFSMSFSGQNINSNISKGTIIVESISFTGLRPGKTYFMMPSFRKNSGSDKKEFNVVYGDKLINSDEFTKVNLDDVKENDINKTFKNLRAYGTVLRVNITQRFVISEENIEIYPELLDADVDQITGSRLYNDLEKIVQEITK